MSRCKGAFGRHFNHAFVTAARLTLFSVSFVPGALRELESTIPLTRPSFFYGLSWFLDVTHIVRFFHRPLLDELAGRHTVV